MSTGNVFDTEKQMVVFQLNTESYGIDIFRVNEIIRMREITPIPQTESHIRGLVNLRGKTIPVVDLRLKFGLAAQEDAESTRIIVVEGEHGNVGVVVDGVREVVTLQPQDVDEAPSIVTDLNTDFVRGVAKSADGLITLLDLDKALSA